MFSTHYKSEIVKVVFSEHLGLIVIALQTGEVDSFIMWVENEGNVDYEEATEILKKGHLTILKAVKKVLDSRDDFGV